jgi:hypothetical protein
MTAARRGRDQQVLQQEVEVAACLGLLQLLQSGTGGQQQVEVRQAAVQVVLLLAPCPHLQGWQLAAGQQAAVAGQGLAVGAMARCLGVLRVVRAAAAGMARGMLLLALLQTSQRCPNR